MDPVDIEVGRLVLRDRHGRIRGELGCTDDGVSRLALHDGRGTVRALLAVGEEEGPVLVLSDRNGKIRASLTLAETELPLPFSSTDAAGGTAWKKADLGQRSFAVMTLSDEIGNPRLKLSVTSGDGPAAIGIYRGDDSPMAQLTSDIENKDSAFILYDSKGTPCIHAGVSAEGQPHYRSWDRRPFWRRWFFSDKA
jgi:hypothetical protein